MRALRQGLIVLALTALSQLGGLAWLLALAFRRRLLAFGLFYALISTAALFLAPIAGRVPLPCFGADLRAQSPLFCLLNRQYVTSETAIVVADPATAMAQDRPGTVTLALDGNFPFATGFPLLPHLSHDDGEKLDLAFYYTDPTGIYLPGQTRAPLGYWAFDPAQTPCPDAALTLRWDFAWLQPLLPDRPLDAARTATALRWLAADPRVTKIFAEPALAERLGVSGPKLRFQGCRAARHDDHIHFQL